jgi:hypothetical protein
MEIGTDSELFQSIPIEGFLALKNSELREILTEIFASSCKIG